VSASTGAHPKIGILVSHPIQHHAPWFRELARRFDLVVHFMHHQDRRAQAAAGFGVEFDWDVDLVADYRHVWLPNVARQPGVADFFGCDTPAIYDVVRAGRFDAFVVFGWNRKSALQGIHACQLARVPVLVRGDSQLRGERSPLWRVIKYPLYRMLLPRLGGYLFVGRRSREYLEHYGICEKRMFFVPHTVDENEFRRDPDLTTGRREELRRGAGIPGDAFVVLFVGKLIDKKRPGDLVRAVARLADDDRRAVHALFVGDGPLRRDLERDAQAAPGRVHFAGFRNQREIPECYRLADVLVLPSDGRETWGLVVNEAMRCGVPAIVAEDAGCAPDLVDDGETGFRYPTGDVDALADRIAAWRGVLRERAPAIESALAAKMRVHSLERATAGLAEALQAMA
jgi:glycosyltransferase involved in cell wall biosynthesis